MQKIRIGIAGYGNLGRGVESAVNSAEDMTLAAVFTRRAPQELKIASQGVPVFALSEAEEKARDIDVMIICGGSATDLPAMTPSLSEHFNVVDSFDTHANIPAHFAMVDRAACESGKVAIISSGWDPGLFSLSRLYLNCVLPDGNDYTFWGRGVSQGHSDAIRRIEGVEDARQYTVPVPEALARVRSGECPVLSVREKHTRECYVVAKEGADLAKIESEIKNMPNYFDEYDTTVNFITKAELERDHGGIPHGGFVIRNGRTGLAEHPDTATAEFSLRLDSNPGFTGSVLTACARAAYRMNVRGLCGCKTLFDIAPADLSPMSPDEIRRRFL